jgi:hypothetical protein
MSEGRLSQDYGSAALSAGLDERISEHLSSLTKLFSTYAAAPGKAQKGFQALEKKFTGISGRLRAETLSGEGLTQGMKNTLADIAVQMHRLGRTDHAAEVIAPVMIKEFVDTLDSLSAAAMAKQALTQNQPARGQKFLM